MAIRYLSMADGTIYRGDSFGADRPCSGEVVFNTSMTGYQEMLTDPSYAGQILVLTYPLIGNYGINAEDMESRSIQVAGLVVRSWAETPSHGLSVSNLHDYLYSQGIPGVSGVDTRAIARKLRDQGVMMGRLTTEEMATSPRMSTGIGANYGEMDFVGGVTTQDTYTWASGPQKLHSRTLGERRIVVMDFGVKYNILRILKKRGYHPIVVPATMSAAEVLSFTPEAVLLSPGPGDPALLDYLVVTAKSLIGRLPIMGICLGHQVLAKALGGKTYKLKFGHRGANHPVVDLVTGKVSITAQNHGYAVDPMSLPRDVEVSHLNLNDETVEGLRHRSLPILSIQFHSEASPGPRDNEYLFDRFLDVVETD
jgi:carbamoyl-phosphate synthase small subunit